MEKSLEQEFKEAIERGEFFSHPSLMRYGLKKINSKDRRRVTAALKAYNIEPYLIYKFSEPAENRKDFRSVVLLGPPGIGKSTISENLYRRYKELTGHDVQVHYINLNGVDVSEFRGLPVIYERTDESGEIKKEGKYVKIKDHLPDFNKINKEPTILIFDECNTTDPKVLDMLRDLLRTGEIKGIDYKIPDDANIRIVFIGNVRGESPNLFINALPTAFLNRGSVCYITLPETPQEMDEYLRNIEGIHPLIVGYLRENLTIGFGNQQYNKLHCVDVCENSLDIYDGRNVNYDEQPFPTPRTWMLVSKTLEGFDRLDDKELNYEDLGFAIAKHIGEIHAKDFVNFLKFNEFIISSKVFFDEQVDDQELLKNISKMIISSNKRLDADLLNDKASEYGVNLMWAQYYTFLLGLKFTLKTALQQETDKNVLLNKALFVINRFTNCYMIKLENAEIRTTAMADLSSLINHYIKKANLSPKDNQKLSGKIIQIFNAEKDRLKILEESLFKNVTISNETGR